MPARDLIHINRCLDQIDRCVGLPAEVVTARSAHHKIARQRSEHRDSLPIARKAAAEQLLEWAQSDEAQPPDTVTDALRDAAASDAAAAAYRELVNQAVGMAEGALKRAAFEAVPEINSRLATLVDDALVGLETVVGKVPPGTDDASAFRSSAEVQQAWLTLSAAADTVSSALNCRNSMCKRTAAALDDVEPRGLYATGLRWPLAGGAAEPDPKMPVAHQLREMISAGVPLRLHDSDEIAAAIRAMRAKEKEAERAAAAGHPARRRAASF